MSFFADYQSQLSVLGYVALSMLLGAAIGFERELEGKPAGLRTHMLVSGAATLFVSLVDVMVEHFSAGLGGGLVQSDPVRIIEAVVTGVSFLGAGTIVLRGRRHHVEGLTTAASILFIAGVGVCVALRQVVLAIGAVLLVLVTLRGLGALDAWLERRLRERQM